MKDNFSRWLGDHRQQLLLYGLPAVAFLAGIAIPSPFGSCGSSSPEEADSLLADSLFVDTVNMVMPDHSVYDGSVRKGTMIRDGGYGMLTMEDGTIYEGEWKDDALRYGTRTGRFSVYRGKFDDSLCNDGFGIIEYSESFIMSKRRNGLDDSEIVKSYTGNWKHNNKDGIGRSMMADGSMEFGIYRDGIFQPADGARYNAGETVYGIDISHYKKYINWDNLALYCDEYGNVTNHNEGFMQPVLFVYMKVSDGASYQDTTYALRCIEASRHGIRKGVFHYFRPGVNIDAQVRNFLASSSYEEGDLPPALDVEEEKEIAKCGRDVFCRKVLEWLEKVEGKLRVRPIIYTRESIRDTYMTDPRFKKYKFWISRYNRTGPECDDWTFWQKSENGHISGCDEPVDIDVYRGGYDSFLCFPGSR